MSEGESLLGGTAAWGQFEEARSAESLDASVQEADPRLVEPHQLVGCFHCRTVVLVASHHHHHVPATQRFGPLCGISGWDMKASWDRSSLEFLCWPYVQD